MSHMNKEFVSNIVGSFTWGFGSNFFIEGSNGDGNFIWSDPDYGGNNSIYKTTLSYKEWCKSEGIVFGRDKGIHKIIDYVGDFVWNGENKSKS